MDIAFLIGRIIAGAFFLLSGFNHFTKLSYMTGYAAAKGVPAPQLAVIGSGALLVVAGLSLLTGFRPRIGIAAAVLFLLPVSLVMHQFWTIDDPTQQAAEMGNFMKNLAIMGLTLMLLAIPRPWPRSIDRSVPR